MVPHIHEQLAREHRQNLLREAEARNALPPPPSPRRLTARLGRYLIAVGTRLQGAHAVE